MAYRQVIKRGLLRMFSKFKTNNTYCFLTGLFGSFLLMAVILSISPLLISTVKADGIPESHKSKNSATGSKDKSSPIANTSNSNNSNAKAVNKAKNGLPAYSLTDNELAKYQYCGKDSDCMQVINGCCQCMQGDPFTAINKDMLGDFMKQFSCTKVTCPDDVKTHSCNDGVVSCVNFKCRYVGDL